MKQLLLFLLCLGALALTSCKKDDPESTKTFPDANFRKVLTEWYGFKETNGDIDPNLEANKTLFIKINAFDISNNNISSLKGIEYFAGLIKLGCYSNQLTTLDLSKNTKLTELLCYNNQLTTLYLPQSTTLTELWCHDNRLTSLDLSKNPALVEVRCNNNQISKLDLSKNTELKLLRCHKNQLSELNLSKNTKLYILVCNRNQLSTLDISMLSGFNQSDELLCGNQQPDKELTLRLTSAQNNYLKDFDQRAENVRVKKVIVD